MTIITITIFIHLNNGCINPVSDRIYNWRTLSNYRILIIKTRFYLGYWVPWTNDVSDPLTLPTVRYIYIFNFLTAHHQANKYHQTLHHIIGIIWPIALSYLMLPATDVLLVTVENIPPNTTWYKGEIEPSTRFKTNTTCVDFIFIKTLLTHSEISTAGFCNLVPNHIFYNTEHENFVGIMILT